MSEQIREQVSAFLDGELPGSEAELLLKRLTRDGDLRESFGRYALIGECLRGGTGGRLSQGFAARVNQVIDGEPLPAGAGARTRTGAAWWRPFAGVAVAAGVAAVAVVALQHRTVGPSLREGVAATAAAVGVAADPASALVTAAPGRAGGVQPVRTNAPVAGALVLNTLGGPAREQISYTTPVATTDALAGSPGARLTNYVFVHSNYSWGLGHSNFIDLLADGEAPDLAAPMNGAGSAVDAPVSDRHSNRGPAAIPARNSRRDP